MDPIVVARAIQFVRAVTIHNSITEEELEQLVPIDLGEVIQRVTGTTIKSYGGLGGLKTVSFRSIGASNTSLTVDGFPASNAQVGQSNLSQIQMESVLSVTAVKGGGFFGLLPVSTREAGSAIFLSTFENQLGRDTLQLKTSMKTGSFGYLDGFGSAKVTKKNFYISTFGKPKRRR